MSLLRTFVIPSLIMIFMGAFFAFTPQEAHACSCLAVYVSGPEMVQQNDAVFRGVVTDVTEFSGAFEMQTKVSFDINETWKGTTGPTVTIESSVDNGANCGYNFEVGTEYFVVANRPQGGVLTTGACSGTAPIIPERNMFPPQLSELSPGTVPSQPAPSNPTTPPEAPTPSNPEPDTPNTPDSPDVPLQEFTSHQAPTTPQSSPLILVIIAGIGIIILLQLAILLRRKN